MVNSLPSKRFFVLKAKPHFPEMIYNKWFRNYLKLWQLLPAHNKSIKSPQTIELKNIL